METIQCDILREILEFSSLPEILNAPAVSVGWKIVTKELYGKNVHKTQRVLCPIILRVSEDDLPWIMNSVLKKTAATYAEYLEQMGRDELKLLKMAVCLYAPDNCDVTKEFLSAAKVLGKDFREFFMDVLQKTTKAGKIFDNEIFMRHTGSDLDYHKLFQEIGYNKTCKYLTRYMYNIEHADSAEKAWRLICFSLLDYTKPSKQVFDVRQRFNDMKIAMERVLFLNGYSNRVRTKIVSLCDQNFYPFGTFLRAYIRLHISLGRLGE
jgi:hypothetical protein